MPLLCREQAQPALALTCVFIVLMLTTSNVTFSITLDYNYSLKPRVSDVCRL